MLMCQVYAGYVDDIRNTDNAWIETRVVHFHDDDDQIFHNVDIKVREMYRFLLLMIINFTYLTVYTR